MHLHNNNGVKGFPLTDSESQLSHIWVRLAVRGGERLHIFGVCMCVCVFVCVFVCVCVYVCMCVCLQGYAHSLMYFLNGHTC